MDRYYELPINFGKLMQPNTDLPTVELKMSIAQNINLMITSKYNEHRFDDTYGCEIWDMDFELILVENVWKERINKSLLQSLKKHELRLEGIETTIDVKEEEFVHKTTGIKGVRKKITVYVNGKVKETGQQYNFSTNLFLSPISFD
jgi:hypothetical protein